MGLARVVKRGVAAAFPNSLMVESSRAEPTLALTFDDGPHPAQTPRLLDYLAEAGACATFFLQGSQAQAWPGLVRAIHAGGHQVANHAWSHTSACALSAQAYVAEVERTQDLLQDLLGVALAADLRPPYGDLTVGSFVTLARRGWRQVLWSMDSEDSWILQAPDLAAHVLAREPAAGDIVLFHDDYLHSVEAMPAILAGVAARGLGTCRIDRVRTGLD